MAAIKSRRNIRSQKFPFLHLAPEIQKMIIEKYYEDEWLVEVTWHDGYLAYKWGSKFISAPLPVSRQFYAEMKQALYSSRSGTLLYGFGMSKNGTVKARFDEFISRNTPFDNAIREISIHSSALTHEYLVNHKQRFRLLKTIEVTSVWRDDNIIGRWIMKKLEKIDLLEFMTERYDAALMSTFHKFIKDFAFTIMSFDLTRLDNIAMHWMVDASHLKCQCSNPVCPVRDATILLFIKIGKDRTEILSRKIRPKAAHYLTSSDAVTHLRLQKAMLDHQLKY